MHKKKKTACSLIKEIKKTRLFAHKQSELKTHTQQNTHVHIVIIQKAPVAKSTVVNCTMTDTTPHLNLALQKHTTKALLKTSR